MRRGAFHAQGILTILALATVLPGHRGKTRGAEDGSVAVKIQWRSVGADTNRSVVEITGLPGASLRALAATNWTTPQWQELLGAKVETGNLVADFQLPPMQGRYEVTASNLQFIPAFPLEPGVRYRAEFRPHALPVGSLAGGTSPVSSTWWRAARAAEPSTVITEVYPTATVLPENLLKVYLHFSAPMSRGHIYDRIHLRDADGALVDLPFLEIDEELWNREMTRLTLFLDPGRIKRGVQPLEEVGPSIEEGKSYTLVIDRDWLDAEGSPLREGFSRNFTVGPADREPPDPATWKLSAPKAESRLPLTLAFPEPMDHALTERMLKVVDAEGRLVAGKAVVGPQERQWTFVPERPWSRGTHCVQIPTIIEDLAGNNIGKPFDVDLHEAAPRRGMNTVVTLEFVAN